MIMGPRALSIVGLLLLGLGCQPAPAPECPECVCECPEPPAAPAAASETAQAPVAPPITRRQRSGQARRARGLVSARPGSGAITERTEAERKQMSEVFQGFLKAAETRTLVAVKPFLTARLSTVLEKNAVRYEARFFRGLEPTLKAFPSGLEIAETRDSGNGNIEALFRFGDGHERRVVLFLEEGAWKLNRL